MTDDYDLAVRKYLRAKRREKEISQKALADMLGKPQSYVSKIENGERRCTVGDFIEFSKVLQFDLRSAIRRIADVKPRVS
jgi:transcriptional regulator with XRE-family HTH domain